VAVDAVDLVSDAGGELIDCCHAFKLRREQGEGKRFVRFFCVGGGETGKGLNAWGLCREKDI
jgi:hypothetical protein